MWWCLEGNALLGRGRVESSIHHLARGLDVDED